MTTSSTGIEAFDTTLQQTNLWLKDVMEEEGWKDRNKALIALRTVLHLLRDRLPTNEAVQLAAELPMLLRGIYFEGWKPSEAPKKRTREAFISAVASAFSNDANTNPEEIIRAVFSVLADHLSSGEVADIKGSLPKELQELWP